MNGAATRSPDLDDLRARRDDILGIAARHGVDHVRIFGSVARGDADARDVDVVVDLPEDARGFHAFGILDDLRQDLEDLIGYEVDVVTLREPFSPKGAEIARRIEQEAIDL